MSPKDGKRSLLWRWKWLAFILIPLVPYSKVVYERASQTEGPNSYGPFTGTVLDYDTKQPIAGAQVCIKTSIKSRWNAYSQSGSDYFVDFGETDSSGNYKLPKRMSLFKKPMMSRFEITIYKAGYILYPNGFLGPEKLSKLGVPMDKPRVQDNVVYLKKWDNSVLTEEDHAFIGGGMLPCGSGLRETWKFCEEAKEELMYYCMGVDRNRKGCEEYVHEKIYGDERKK